jgi:phosphoribosylformylglycinamidine synthase
MARTGDIGAEVQTYGHSTRDAFAEDQGRYLVTVRGDTDEVQKLAKSAGVNCDWIGTTGGYTLRWIGEQDQIEANVPLADLRAAHEGFFPKLMGADAALA